MWSPQCPRNTLSKSSQHTPCLGKAWCCLVTRLESRNMCDCFLLTSAAELDLHSFYPYLGQAGLEPETFLLHPQEWCGLQVCVTMTDWRFHFFTVTMHHLRWQTHDLFLTLTQTWVFLIFFNAVSEPISFAVVLQISSQSLLRSN